jgi:hypothetical protein
MTVLYDTFQGRSGGPIWDSDAVYTVIQGRVDITYGSTHQVFATEDVDDGTVSVLRHSLLYEKYWGQFLGGYEYYMALEPLDDDTVSENLGAWVVADVVPVPAAVFLFGSGLIGLAGIRRKFRK